MVQATLVIIQLVCFDGEPSILVDIHVHHITPYFFIFSILKHVTGDTTLADGVDSSAAPDKPLQEKEKNLLEKFKPVLQKFVHESTDLQLSALYALQVHCHLNNFPKGEFDFDKQFCWSYLTDFMFWSAVEDTYAVNNKVC